jgi:hypothetical protein
MSASEGKELPRDMTAKWAYVALLCSSPMLFVFTYLGNFYEGIGATGCSVLILMVIRTRWDLRKHAWFWITIFFAVLLQVPIVLLIPWKNKTLTGISVLPIVLLDYGIVWGCVKLAEKVMQRARAPDEAHPPGE